MCDRLNCLKPMAHIYHSCSEMRGMITFSCLLIKFMMSEKIEWYRTFWLVLQSCLCAAEDVQENMVQWGNQLVLSTFISSQCPLLKWHIHCSTKLVLNHLLKPSDGILVKTTSWNWNEKIFQYIFLFIFPIKGSLLWVFSNLQTNTTHY